MYTEFMGYATYSVNAWKLLGKLHNHADDKRCSQSWATYELCHRYSRLGLLSSFFGSHFFDVFFHLVTGSQPPQSFTGFLLPLFSNEQISRAKHKKREREAVIFGGNRTYIYMLQILHIKFLMKSIKDNLKDISLDTSIIHDMCFYLGDSGQTGSSNNCRMAGQIASNKRTGQPSSVPRICSMPSTWETRRPTVTASWFTVPRPPLRFSGAISDMYMGTNEVFKPQLTPMMNRPKNNISYEWAIFVKPIRHPPTMPSTLFSSKPPFLSVNEKERKEKTWVM